MLDRENDPTQALRDFRALFPGLADQAYFDVAARGLISTNVRAAVDGFLDGRMTTGGDKQAMFRTIESARSRFAELIGADADEIGYAKNISDGVNAVAAAIDWRGGDNVVLCQTLEHPANILPWHNLKRTRGVAMKDVPAGPDGRMPVDAMVRAIDAGTRAVAVSAVSFAPGFRTDLAPVGWACRAAGALLIVDGAQSVGNLATDVEREGIDVLLASTQKGLLGLYGMGFLYVRRAVAEGLMPAYLSRLGVELVSDHEATSSGFEDFRYAAGARRFDVGNYNYIAAAAADRSLEDLLALGPAVVEAQAAGRAADLREGLKALDIPVFESPNACENAHIVAIGRALADEHDQASDPDIVSLHAALTSARVAHSIRRGVLRLAFHAYNDSSDVERTLEATRAWRRAPAA